MPFSREEILNEINNLKKQKEQFKEVFIKCIGALEVLEGMLKENDKKDTKKDDTGA